MDQLYYPIQPLDPLHRTHVTLDTTLLGVQPWFVRQMENGAARYLFVPLQVGNILRRFLFKTHLLIPQSYFKLIHIPDGVIISNCSKKLNHSNSDGRRSQDFELNLEYMIVHWLQIPRGQVLSLRGSNFVLLSA